MTEAFLETYNLVTPDHNLLVQTLPLAQYVPVRNDCTDTFSMVILGGKFSFFVVVVVLFSTVFSNVICSFWA